MAPAASSAASCISRRAPWNALRATDGAPLAASGTSDVSVVDKHAFPDCASTVATEKRQTFSATENSEVPWCGFAGAPLAADAVPAAHSSATMHAHAIQSRRHMAASLRATADL